MRLLFVHQLQDPALWSYARGRRKYDLDSEFWKLGHGELKHIECGQKAQQAWISSDFSRMWSVLQKKTRFYPETKSLCVPVTNSHPGAFPT